MFAWEERHPSVVTRSCQAYFNLANLVKDILENYIN